MLSGVVPGSGGVVSWLVIGLASTWSKVRRWYQALRHRRPS
jgi:hypothetical protein